MGIKLQGMSGVYVARLFSTLIYLCRTNPLIIEREDFNTFATNCINSSLMLVEYTQEDIIAILNCIDEPDSNGINVADKFAGLEIDEIANYIERVFKHILELKIVRIDDLWEGYPLREALDILVKQNPNFDLKSLFEIVN